MKTVANPIFNQPVIGYDATYAHHMVNEPGAWNPLLAKVQAWPGPGPLTQEWVDDCDELMATIHRRIVLDSGGLPSEL